MRKILIVLLPLLPVAYALTCVFSDEFADESASKSEWSILQHYEYTYRDKSNSEPYLLFNTALGSKYNVIGFPTLKKNTGFVFILANTAGKPYIKAMRQESFVVTAAVLKEVQEKVAIREDVKEFISSHIVR